MAQFDVHRTRGDAARLAPYLVILQNDFLNELASVIVAPMRPATKHGKRVERLHVEVEFEGDKHVIAPEQMISLPRSLFGKRAGSVASVRQPLLAALDFVFLGF